MDIDVNVVIEKLGTELTVKSIENAKLSALVDMKNKKIFELEEQIRILTENGGEE